MTPRISQHRREEQMGCLRDGTDNILREHHANLEHGNEKTQTMKKALKNSYAMTLP